MRLHKNLIIALSIGFVAGFLLLFGLHVLRAEQHGVHYHANFALYINGDRDEFDNFTFYEEIQACQPGETLQPGARVHMHDFINHVIHVHDSGVTWGHFFSNLGYTLDDNAIITDDGVFIDGEDGTLTFILNGEPTRAIANQLIQDTDVLLVNYGTESEEVITERYANIPNDAQDYNEVDDPSSCAGEHDVSFGHRLLQALTIRN